MSNGSIRYKWNSDLLASLFNIENIICRNRNTFKHIHRLTNIEAPLGAMAQFKKKPLKKSNFPSNKTNRLIYFTNFSVIIINLFAVNVSFLIQRFIDHVTNGNNIFI